MKEATYFVPVDRHPPYRVNGPVPSATALHNPLSAPKKRVKHHPKPWRAPVLLGTATAAKPLPEAERLARQSAQRLPVSLVAVPIAQNTGSASQKAATGLESAETRVAMMKRLWRRGA